MSASSVHYYLVGLAVLALGFFVTRAIFRRMNGGR